MLKAVTIRSEKLSTFTERLNDCLTNEKIEPKQIVKIYYSATVKGDDIINTSILVYDDDKRWGSQTMVYDE